MLNPFFTRHRLRFLLGVMCLATPLTVRALPPTPLEAQQYTRISRSAEISEYMHVLAANNPQVRLEVLGHSVQGRAIEALVFSSPPKTLSQGLKVRRLKMMLIGSQHGASEPATGEAMIAIARDLSTGALPNVLDSIEVMVIPNANPDGRDLGRRANANGVNINVDFATMTQPETRALKGALLAFQPDVILDSHESAVLKRQSLGREGYMTDFNAQFESSNHPSTPSALRELAYNKLLPEITRRVSADKLPAHRYIGEIVSIKQAIANGGLTLKNFRNTAGMHGVLSFLVETKLDNSDYSYPSYRNIKVRLERQLICIRNFIHVMQENQLEIVTQLDAVRASQPAEAITLKARYVTDPTHPYEKIPMRRIDTRAIEMLTFADHRRVETAGLMPLPRTLVITEYLPEMARFLDAQFIRYETVQNTKTVTATLNHYAWGKSMLDGATLLASKTQQVQLKPGALLVDLSQPQGRTAMLLLDPRSNSTVFMYPEYQTMFSQSKTFFVYLVM